jgi:ubiquinone/menaquinone biosynthesis C-methylase UbiE
VSNDVRDAYDGAAASWAAGPAAMYRAMAEPLVEASPIRLSGTSVLDFGAGSGATSSVLARAGAGVVAADLSFAMLQIDRGTRPTSVNADVRRLPFRDRAFDLAAGAFVISHLPDPATGLREIARTVRAGGAVISVGFDGRWEYPAKQTVEDVLTGFGFRRPHWYEAFKHDVEPLTASPDALAAAARAAGLEDVAVHEQAVDVGVRSAGGIMAWRLGTPIYATFLEGLDGDRRAEIMTALREALGPAPPPLVPELLVLVARVRA